MSVAFKWWCFSFRDDCWFSFRNDPHRFIVDLCQIYDRQNYRFEMIAHCLFEMTDRLSFRYDGRTLSSEWLDDDHFDMIKIFSFWNDDKPALCKGWGFDALCLLSKRQSFSLSYKKDCITLTSFQREYDRISERYFLLMKKTGNSEKTAPQKTLEILSFQKEAHFV